MLSAVSRKLGKPTEELSPIARALSLCPAMDTSHIMENPTMKGVVGNGKKKNGLENLGGAVIDRAVKDYIKTKLDMEKAFDLLEELQDFFEGKGYEFWSDGEVSGKEVMNRCDEVVEKKLKTWRKRREKEMAAAV